MINDKLIGVMTVHVDDFLQAGRDLLYLNIIPKLRETFSFGREENCNFWYLGLNIYLEKTCTAIDQNNDIPAGIYLLKVNNRNTGTRCEIYSKLTIKIPERHHWHRSGIFIVNFEHISHLALVFLLLTLSM